MFNFTGKKALVAGGLGLIGKPTVEILKELGCNVFIADTRAEESIDTTNYHRFRNYVLGCNPDYFVNATYPEFIKDHYKSFLYAAEIVAQNMRKRGGAIVNVASIYGYVDSHEWLYPYTGVNPPSPEYHEAKANIIKLSRDMAVAFKGKPRVNSVSPGGILSNQGLEFQTRYEMIAPMVSAESVAQTIVFLLGNEYINGQDIIVDAGFTL
jgi:NAD(P)-dependent dehydrogenase (short-subunit alcohol dehydrogenase family)